APTDLRRRLPLERPARDLGNLRGQRVRQEALHCRLVVVVEDLILRAAVDRGEEQRREVPARIDALRGAVRGAGTLPGRVDGDFGVVGDGGGGGREPHQRPVAGGVRAGIAAVLLTRPHEVVERAAGGGPDVKAPPLHAQVPVTVPPAVRFELVNRVEALLRDEALGEAQRHRRVVGPLAWLQVERPAADDIGERLERAGQFELQGGAEGIPGGEPEQAPAVAIERGHWWNPQLFPSTRSTTQQPRTWAACGSQQWLRMSSFS